MQFCGLSRSKMEISETDVFDTLTIQNDQISYGMTFGDLWEPIGTYGDPRGSMGTYGDLWGPMGASGGL